MRSMVVGCIGCMFIEWMSRAAASFLLGKSLSVWKNTAENSSIDSNISHEKAGKIMDFHLLLFLLGRMMLLMGGALCIPLGISLYEAEPDSLALAFALPSAAAVLIGGLLSLPHRERKPRLGVREGALFMMLSWCLLGLIGLLPYVLSGQLSWLNAMFESIADFTTTGASTIQADLPPSLLLWRSLTQWIGGLNAMVLLMTVIPQVNGGFGLGFALEHSVSLSPMLSRMRRTGLSIAWLYTFITLFFILLYWLCGLSPFDAINWAMVTISTSGSYTTSQSLAAGSYSLEFVSLLCMLVACGNFFLYWCAFRRRDWHILWDNAEIRVLLGLVLLFGLLSALQLWRLELYSFPDSLRYGFFHVVSFASTTGFEELSLENWPDFNKYLLFLLGITGGCIGSPTGGFKLLRMMILCKAATSAIRQTLHPRMISHITVDGATVSHNVVSNILSFFYLYLMIFFLFVLLISLSGTSILEAMGIAAACLSGVSSAATLYGSTASFIYLPALTKVFCCVLMILGKMEIFAFLLVVQSGVRGLRDRW